MGLEPNDYMLKISAGPSTSNLTVVSVNDEFQPMFLDSEHFKGYICVRLLNFNGVTPSLEMTKEKVDKVHSPISNPASNYFYGKNRKYSIMMQGRFTKEYHGDEILFGAELLNKVAAPAGLSVAIRIAKWLDPAVDADGSSENPYMYSPLVTSINSLAIYPPGAPELSNVDNQQTDKKAVESLGSKLTKIAIHDEAIGAWQYHTKPVPEASFHLFNSEKEKSQIITYEKRKKHFSNLQNRKSVKISPDYIYCMDFYDAYFDLNNFAVKLPGFTLNAFKYYDGRQKIQYSCRTRDGKTVFFVIVFEFVEKKVYGL